MRAERSVRAEIGVMAPDQRKLQLRRGGSCRTCGLGLPAGAVAWYRKSDRSVACRRCVSNGEPVIPGVAGASAKAEYEKRRRRREEKTRASHPRIGGLLLAMRDAPASETAWRIGYEGEQRVAAELEKRLAGTPARLLHDRRIPATRANIDHVIVAPPGVFVIDTKRYSGRIEKRVDGGLLSPRRERLVVAGRDKTKLVDGVVSQGAAVAEVLAAVHKDHIPIHPLLCFVDGEFPFLRMPTVNGIRIVSPKLAAQCIREPGPLPPNRIEAIADHLDAQLPAYLRAA